MLNLVVATKDFNTIDKLIAYLRSNRIKKYIKKDDRVLDFGCGSQGYFLRYMSAKINSGLGLDFGVIDEKSTNLEFKQFHFINKLPKNIGNYDKVVMLAVFEHIEINQVGNLMSEFKRVLSQNGQIILTTPTPRGKLLLELLAKINIINREEIADHKKYYSKADINQIASSNKLKLVSYNLFQLGLNSVAILEKV